MFVVTGASGQLGRGIIQKLADRVPVSQIRATCRDPSKVDDLAALGVQIRHGDFSDRDSMRRAFEGASQVLIVSSNARALGGDPLAQHRNAFDAARDAGVERIVYTSHMAVGTTSVFPPMHDHAATEALLGGCGLAWTALRHGYYSASGIAILMAAFQAGTLNTAADGPVSWTAHADLAEAAAFYLTDTSRESGPTPPLTGQEALNLSELAQMASALLGRPIVRRVLPDEEIRVILSARGVPTPLIDISLGFYAAARHGEFAAVDPALEALLGRPPVRMRDLLAAALKC